MRKYYSIILSICIISIHAANVSPGQYYEDLTARVGTYVVDHRPWFLEAAVNESFVSVQSKEGEDEAARNLACAALNCKILEGENIVYEDTRPFKARYRKYRSLEKPIDHKIIISSESVEFLERFEGVKCAEGDPLYPYVQEWEAFSEDRDIEMKNGKAEKNKGKIVVPDDFDVYLRAAFKVPEETMTARRERFDDTEQQFVRALEGGYPRILQDWLQAYYEGRKSAIEASGVAPVPQKVSIVISPLIHTKLDPCPYCLNRMAKYFKGGFWQATGQTLLNNKGVLDSLSVGLEYIYVLPIICSRMEYKTRPRAILPWNRTIKTDNFRVAASDITVEDDGRSLKKIVLPEAYGLILGITHYMDVWEEREKRKALAGATVGGAGGGAAAAAAAGGAGAAAPALPAGGEAPPAYGPGAIPA